MFKPVVNLLVLAMTSAWVMTACGPSASENTKLKYGRYSEPTVSRWIPGTNTYYRAKVRTSRGQSDDYVQGNYWPTQDEAKAQVADYCRLGDRAGDSCMWGTLTFTQETFTTPPPGGIRVLAPVPEGGGCYRKYTDTNWACEDFSKDKCTEDWPYYVECGWAPYKDSDSDGIADRFDSCPKEKETPNGYQDGDGCPDVAPPKATFEQARQATLMSYRECLGRRPESNAVYANQVDYARVNGIDALYNGICGSPEAAGVAARTTAIKTAFHDCLGRDTDPEGLQSQLQYIAAHGTQATRDAICRSPEGQTEGAKRAAVNAVYQVCLGRAAESAAVILQWTDFAIKFGTEKMRKDVCNSREALSRVPAQL